MAQKRIASIWSGKITSGIEPDSLPLQTIAFVYGQLAGWRDDPDRPSEQAEDKLNLQLCKFLDALARKEFPMIRFDHEEYQVGRRRIDLSASPAESVVLEARPYTIYDPVLVLEGKRLPAPSPDREKEYVTSEAAEKISGGIQRFKQRLHGGKLNLAVMIGYVQKRSPAHWCKKVNEWISELAGGKIKDGCAWATGETLKPLIAHVAEGIASYRSVHGRSSGDDIELRHLWVVMRKNM